MHGKFNLPVVGLFVSHSIPNYNNGWTANEKNPRKRRQSAANQQPAAKRRKKPSKPKRRKKSTGSNRKS